MSSRIIDRASNAIFGKPLIANNFRGLLVEAIVAEALGQQWKWVSADWAAWDFERADGTRLEVKQSAALQSWHRPDSPIASPRFDCAARTGSWDGPKWFPDRRRFADIYIFAYHSETDIEAADHRNPAQWRFFIVPEKLLPNQKTIALSRIKAVGAECQFDSLLNEVSEFAPAI